MVQPVTVVAFTDIIHCEIMEDIGRKTKIIKIAGHGN